ncbi:MAG: HAD-IA family hydrolase [Dysgonamonadaceae bacterium]|jgi:HAD superfamily hydrolase (TIGR01509 family)|nr:HAD-IA family hydrolase [Dysgonamonadaceae bacterium]
MIRAVLFDMDGVLYDSMPYHVRAWHETILSLGINSDPDDYYLYEGLTGSFTIDILFNRAYGRDATDKEKMWIYEQKSRRFEELSDYITLMPGACEVLSAVKKLGRQIVVVTGSGQQTLFKKLEKDFPETFKKELLVTAYDVTHGKPDPEPYLLGLKKAKVAANEAIVVENAPFGVQSAVEAKIFTIGVNTGPLPSCVLSEFGAALTFQSMVDLAKNIETIIETTNTT